MFTKKEIKEAKDLAEDLRKRGLSEETVQSAAKASLISAKYNRKKTSKQITMSEESKKIGQINCYINNDWRKRWIPFIKYDWDWDFAFIDTLIVKKLKLMKEFYLHDLKKKEKDLWTTNSKDGNRKIVKEINEVLKAYKEYNTTMKVGDEEKELRIKFYQKLGELSGNWWD